MCVLVRVQIPDESLNETHQYDRSKRCAHRETRLLYFVYRLHAQQFEAGGREGTMPNISRDSDEGTHGSGGGRGECLLCDPGYELLREGA